MMYKSVLGFALLLAFLANDCYCAEGHESCGNLSLDYNHSAQTVSAKIHFSPSEKLKTFKWIHSYPGRSQDYGFDNKIRQIPAKYDLSDPFSVFIKDLSPSDDGSYYVECVLYQNIVTLSGNQVNITRPYITTTDASIAEIDLTNARDKRDDYGFPESLDDYHYDYTYYFKWMPQSTEVPLSEDYGITGSTDVPLYEDNKMTGSKEVPLYEDYGMTGSTDVPLYEDFGMTGSTDVPFYEDYGMTGSTDVPLYEDYGMTGSTDVPLYKDDGMTGSTDVPLYEDYGMTGSKEVPLYEDYGMTESEEVPLYEDYGMSGSTDVPLYEDYGMTGSTDVPLDEEYGMTGSTAHFPWSEGKTLSRILSTQSRMSTEAKPTTASERPKDKTTEYMPTDRTVTSEIFTRTRSETTEGDHGVSGETHDGLGDTCTALVIVFSLVVLAVVVVIVIVRRKKQCVGEKTSEDNMNPRDQMSKDAFHNAVYSTGINFNTRGTLVLDTFTGPKITQATDEGGVNLHNHADKRTCFEMYKDANANAANFVMTMGSKRSKHDHYENFVTNFN